MFKSFMLMSAVTIAAPALAQTMAAPTSTNAAQPAAAATPATTQQPTVAASPTATVTPSAAASPSATAEPAPATAAAAPSSNPADAVAAVVSTGWSKYDADSNGKLSKSEFGAWMTALREQSPAQKAAVKDPAAWTTAAFAQADKDKNGGITKPELEKFLKG